MISKKTMLVMVVAISAIITWIILSDESNPSFAPEHKTSTGNTQNKTSYNETSIEPPISLVNPTITPYLTEYALPNGTGPNGILVDRDGIVWTVGSTSHKLYRLDPKTNQLQQYQIPEENEAGDYMSWSMIQDNEGFIWFAQFGSNPLWRFDPHLYKFTSFHSLTASPFQMKLDTKTDNIWFTTLSGDSLGVVQKVQNSTDPYIEYKISEFSIGNETLPSGLTLEGNHVWVTELAMGKIAEFESIRDSNDEISNIKKIAEMSTIGRTPFYIPTDILFSNNNTAWITEHGSSTVTKFDIRTQDLTRIPTSQNSFHVASLPFWLQESLDGKGIWFNEHEGDNIGFFDTKNVLTEYKLQNNSDVVFMLNLALDSQNPDKAWFSEWNADKIGVVNRDIPVPFEISSDTNDLVFDTKGGEKHATVDIQITKELMPPNENKHFLFLNTTSSMTPDGELENMTANFSQNSVDLSNSGQPIHDILTLHNESVQPGNYTLGISAGNDLVTKTIFYELTVR